MTIHNQTSTYRVDHDLKFTESLKCFHTANYGDSLFVCVFCGLGHITVECKLLKGILGHLPRLPKTPMKSEKPPIPKKTSPSAAASPQPVQANVGVSGNSLSYAIVTKSSVNSAMTSSTLSPTTNLLESLNI